MFGLPVKRVRRASPKMVYLCCIPIGEMMRLKKHFMGWLVLVGRSVRVVNYRFDKRSQYIL